MMMPPWACMDPHVRPATSSDLPEIIRIHELAFPSFFMTSLGPRFLELYYALVISFPGRIFLVMQGPKGLQGFVCGFLEPARFYLELEAHRWTILGVVLWNLFLQPSLIPRLIASYSQTRQSIHCEELDLCELSSIAVPSYLSRRGIGTELVRKFLENARGRCRWIMLSTDTEGNDPANAFYRGLGFHLHRSFERSKGRYLNYYRLPMNS